MEHIDYNHRFQEALAMAFAAKDESARLAYFDLASFYHRKLGPKAQMHPSADMLRRFVRPKRVKRS